MITAKAAMDTPTRAFFVAVMIFPSTLSLCLGEKRQHIFLGLYTSDQQFVDLKHFDPERARIVATVVHTPPSACGKIFSRLEPRMAVAYHTFNDYNTAPDILAGIRESYDGPLTLADDLLVWNIDAESIRLRRVIGTDEPWPATPPSPAGPPDPSERTEMSDWLEAGRVDLSEN